MEEANEEAQLGALSGILGRNPSTRDEQMAAMVRQGMTSAQAEAAVGPSPTEEMFMSALLGNLLKGYQPPPMPAAPK